MNNDHLFLAYTITIILAAVLLSGCSLRFSAEKIEGESSVDSPQKVEIE